MLDPVAATDSSGFEGHGRNRRHDRAMSAFQGRLFATDAFGSLNGAVTALSTETATELLTGLTEVTVGVEDELGGGV